MAYKEENGISTITCDKCGKTKSASSEIAGAKFFESGWSLNSRAKKYVQVCFNCQNKRTKKITEWAIGKFA